MRRLHVNFALPCPTACSYAGRALKLDPESHVLLSNRSAAYVGLEQFSKALDDAQACLRSKPDFIKGYGRKAYAYLQLKQTGFAEAAYREGLALDKHNTALKQGLDSILKVSHHALQCSDLANAVE